jgi:hypothetical protein
MQTRSIAIVLGFPRGSPNIDGAGCSIVVQLVRGEITYVVAGGGVARDLEVELEMLEAVAAKLRGDLGKACCK